MAHSYLSASASHRWMHCPASAVLADGVSSEGGAAAKRGTELHGLAETALKYGEAGTLGVNPADLAAVAPYVDWARGLVTADPGSHLWLEQRVFYGAALSLPDDIAFGTADCLHLSSDESVLTVGDLKTGAMYVDPVGNSQLALYAAGAYQFLDTLGFDLSRINLIRLVICQPRLSETPYIWEAPAEEVDAILIKAREAGTHAFLNRGKAMAELEPELFGPHEDACRWCPVASTCTALRAVMETYKPKTVPKLEKVKASDFAPVLTPTVMTVEDLRDHFNHVSLMRLWCDAIEQEMYSRTMAGDATGFKMVEGRAGNRRVDDEAEVVTTLLKMGLPPKLFMSAPELLSVPNLEKVLKKDYAEALKYVGEHIVRPPGKPTLVPESDPRPRWVEDKAGSIIDAFAKM